jgi:tripartite-type tricarboxylate transporter receptor subunit TctC
MNAIARVLVAISALAATSAASADGYPNRPVRVIAPGGPGAMSDTITRLVAQKLSDNMGKPFYVENQVGAGQNIGMGNAAKAPPDGYTLLAATSSLVTNPSLYAKLPFDPIKDFSPVTVVGTSPFVLMVNPSVPAKDARELVALIKANPGKYSYASPGVGTTPHLLGELLRLSFGLDLVHVPFSGGPLAATSTMAGHTLVWFAAPATAAQSMNDGKLRALAVTSKTRLQALPDVPTTAEAGLPGEGADTIVGFLAPARTPNGIVSQLHDEIAKIMEMPSVKERFAVFGFEPVANSPEEFAALIKSEIARWAKVIRDANIRSE